MMTPEDDEYPEWSIFYLTIPHAHVDTIREVLNANGLYMDDTCSSTSKGHEVIVWVPGDRLEVGHMDEKAGEFWGAQPPRRPVTLTAALWRRVQALRSTLIGMPDHSDKGMRPVVVVAQMSRYRRRTAEWRAPAVVIRYHSEPVGSTVGVEGFDHAVIAAE